MTLEEIYKNIHTHLSKDGNEGLISMDRINILWEPVLYELIREEAKKNSVELVNGNEELLSLYVLGNLIMINDSLTVSGNPVYAYIDGLTQSTIGSDMLYWGKMWTDTFNGARREIKLISTAEFGRRYTNMMKMDIDENPIAILYSSANSQSVRARLYPASLNGEMVNFIYIRKPDTPFLDYYIDANYKTVFMAAGSSHALTAGEEYRDGTTTGTKASTTSELDIPEDFHPKFQDKMIERLSLPLDDQYKNQYATAKETRA